MSTSRIHCISQIHRANFTCVSANLRFRLRPLAIHGTPKKTTDATAYCVMWQVSFYCQKSAIRSRGVAMVGRVVQPPQAAESKQGGKMIGGWQFDVSRSRNFKLQRQMKGNWINNCDFFYSSSFLWRVAVVLARSGSQKPLATPLIRISLERVVQTSSFAHQPILLWHTKLAWHRTHVTVL